MRGFDANDATGKDATATDWTGGDVSKNPGDNAGVGAAGRGWDAITGCAATTGCTEAEVVGGRWDVMSSPPPAVSPPAASTASAASAAAVAAAATAVAAATAAAVTSDGNDAAPAEGAESVCGEVSLLAETATAGS
mmetsp:Transcript_497/g.999  ORF Transcript_497/g.999 Transcript_497/m.999 type:complete len:136 (+) Transcript_497:603-1010(+)